MVDYYASFFSCMVRLHDGHDKYSFHLVWTGDSCILALPTGVQLMFLSVAQDF